MTWAASCPGEPIQARPPRLGYVVRLYTRQNFRSYRGLYYAAMTCGFLVLLVVAAQVVTMMPVVKSAVESYERLPGVPTPRLATLSWSRRRGNGGWAPSCCWRG